MIKINRTITYRNTALAALLGLSLCVTSYPSSVMASTYSIDQMISRVDETTDNDLVRSHFEDVSGNVYTDESADASGSRLKKASDLPVRYDLREHPDQGSGIHRLLLGIFSDQDDRVKLYQERVVPGGFR